jgi:hypothetical protein
MILRTGRADKWQNKSEECFSSRRKPRDSFQTPEIFYILVSVVIKYAKIHQTV